MINDSVINGGVINNAVPDGAAVPSGIITGTGFDSTITATFVAFGTITGAGFSSKIVQSGTLTGQGFATTVNLQAVDNPDAFIVGAGFSTSAILYGGGDLVGQGFATDALVTVEAFENAYITGGGFDTQVDFTANTEAQATIAGQGFATDAQLYGGGILNGQGFATEAVLLGTAPAFATLTGQGFGSELAMSAVFVPQGTLTGGGFTSVSPPSAVINGAGFATIPSITVLAAGAGGIINLNGNDSATTLNTLTHESTNYTNFGFMHVIHIGGKPYGIKTDGLYALVDGGTDYNFAMPAIPTPINGKAVTKDSDNGTFHSKRVSKVWIDSDFDTVWTPILDGTRKLPHKSHFKGRKLDAARGNTSRYWTWEVAEITELHGFEITYTEHARQRRVK
jgi:hypothetical protein